MILKVKWGDLEERFKKKIEENPVVKSYFETETSILTFIRIKGVDFYAEINKENINTGFKLEFLSDAFELLENPIKPIKLEVGLTKD